MDEKTQLKRLENLKKFHDSPSRGRYLQALPRCFWAWLSTKGRTIPEVVTFSGIGKDALRRYFNKYDVERNHTRVPGDILKRWDERASEVKAHKKAIQHLIYKVPKVELDPSQAYGICSDLHYPTYSEKWLTRFLTVCQFFGIKRMIHVGDLLNLDAISRFAETDRKEKPPLQAELQSFEATVLSTLKSEFSEMWFIAGNHLFRILRALEGHLEASYLFGKLLNESFIESDHLTIGQDKPGSTRLIHRQQGRGRKVLLSEAAEIADNYQQHIAMGHNHRFAIAWSNHGFRVLMLGGLFEEDEMTWRQRGSFYLSWQRAFSIYLPEGKTGVLMPFADGIVRWSDFGCK